MAVPILLTVLALVTSLFIQSVLSTGVNNRRSQAMPLSGLYDIEPIETTIDFRLRTYWFIGKRLDQSNSSSIANLAAHFHSLRF